MRLYRKPPPPRPYLPPYCLLQQCTTNEAPTIYVHFVSSALHSCTCTNARSDSTGKHQDSGKQHQSAWTSMFNRDCFRPCPAAPVQSLIPAAPLPDCSLRPQGPLSFATLPCVQFAAKESRQGAVTRQASAQMCVSRSHGRHGYIPLISTRHATATPAGETSIS